MQRRDFLRFTLLTPFATALPVLAAETLGKPAIEVLPDGKPHRFELGRKQFLLDGAPFQIRSGEMHPARIPNDY